MISLNKMFRCFVLTVKATTSKFSEEQVFHTVTKMLQG